MVLLRCGVLAAIWVVAVAGFPDLAQSQSGAADGGRGASPPTAARSEASLDAAAQARLLEKQLRSLAIQQLLVESGNLDVEAGHASQLALNSAAADFRAAIGSEATGPLGDDELKRLQDASDAFLAFADFTRVNDPDTGITVTLPRNLFSPNPKMDYKPDTAWTTYVSSYGGMEIELFNFGLIGDTPVSLASRLIERRQNVNFERHEITGTEFAIDATADSGGRPYYVAVRGWESNGRIIGFQARFDLDYSSALQVPQMLIPDEAKTSVHPNGRATARKITVSEREGNWRRVVKAIVNRLSSDFEVSNGWRVLSSAGCRKRPTAGRGGQVARKVVRVVFATDRQRVSPQVQAAAPEGTEIDNLFTATPDDALHIGCAVVTVPNNPEVAALIDRPRPTARGQTPPYRPDRHFRLDGIDVYGSSARLGRGEEISLVDEGREGTFERALLFIHGYNTSFADALLRITQIAAALDEDLRVYLFSWPSRERYLSYVDDLDNAERAEQSLQYFMKLILRDANVRQLDVIAHSMGSQSLLRSIDGLKAVFDQRSLYVLPSRPGAPARTTQVRLRLGQVIFAAPDVSRPIFERQLKMLAPYASRVTIYTSDVDRALWLSELLRQSPRAGYLGTSKEPIQAPARNVHLISVDGKQLPKLSPKRVTEFNHNYFANNPSVLADIQSILKDGTSRNPVVRAEKSKSPLRHHFAPVPYRGQPDSFYWKLVEGRRP